MTAQVLGWVPLAGSTTGTAIGVGLFTAALLGFMAAGLSARRNWVRWLFAVAYVLGNLGAVAAAALTPEIFRAQPMVIQANMFAQFILQTAALCFMFTRASREWFATKHVEAGPSGHLSGRHDA